MKNAVELVVDAFSDRGNNSFERNMSMARRRAGLIRRMSWRCRRR